MSSTEKLTKKQKKALAFRERKGKGKAKAVDEDNDVPVLEDQATLEAETQAGAVEGEAGHADHAGAARAKNEGVLGDNQSKKPKKRKREEDVQAVAVGAEPKPKPKKKRRGLHDGEDGLAVAEGSDAEAGEQCDEKGKTKQRFILFIGNLKYTTPKEVIEEHFSACKPPPTVRLLTPKALPSGRQPNKSKGCAFLEFTVNSALQQALKLHQSELDGRMINVELTAGGGGKSDSRIEKLKKRNKELHEQRRKRLEKQAKKPKEEGVDVEIMQASRPQRFSATSGIEQALLKKRTWAIAEPGDAEAKKSKKRDKRPPRSQGTGVNAIPVS